MGDLVYVPVVVVFFALMGGFLVLCDRILGPDDADDRETVEAVTT